MRDEELLSTKFEFAVWINSPMGTEMGEKNLPMNVHGTDIGNCWDENGVPFTDE
uniref:Uncharacterized protein n=1 Tax=Zea mays TaxID=4577 RepID=B6U0K2_MAIZE|nr:hypothetical protein [Zea mays]